MCCWCIGLVADWEPCLLFSFFFADFWGSHLKLRTFWKVGPDGSQGSNQSGRLALSGPFFLQKENQIDPYAIPPDRKLDKAFRLVSTCTSCRGQVSPLSSQGWTCNLGGTGEAWRHLKKDPKWESQKILIGAHCTVLKESGTLSSIFQMGTFLKPWFQSLQVLLQIKIIVHINDLRTFAI